MDVPKKTEDETETILETSHTANPTCELVCGTTFVGKRKMHDPYKARNYKPQTTTTHRPITTLDEADDPARET